MSYIRVHNCNKRQPLRLQSANYGRWLDDSSPIAPGGDEHFRPPNATGAIRLANNRQTLVSGIYVFSNRHHLNDIYFRTTGMVSTDGCRGSMNDLVALTINNCLNERLSLRIETRGGNMGPTGLTVPSRGAGTLTVYLAEGATISFDGNDAPMDSYQVFGANDVIYVTSQSINTTGCNGGGGGGGNGNSIFTVGNCYDFAGVLQIFRGNVSDAWQMVVDPQTMRPVSVAARSTAMVPPPATGAQQAFYRLLLTNPGQRSFGTIPFLYTNDRPPTAVWYNPDSPLVSTMGVCSNAPGTGTIVLFEIRNCSGSTVDLLVRLANGQFSRTPVSISNRRDILITALAGTDIRMVAQGTGTIGDINVSANNNVWYVGPSAVSVNQSVCQMQPEGIFTAFNCETSPLETCMENNEVSGQWTLQQRVGMQWVSIQCIPSGGEQGLGVVPVLETSSTNIDGQAQSFVSSNSVSAAAFRTFSSSNDRSPPYLYTSDFTVNQAYFSNDTVSSSSCGGAGGKIVNLDVTNCTDNPYSISIQANGQFIPLGLSIGAQTRTIITAANGSVLRLESGQEGQGFDYDVVNTEDTIFIGTERISTMSCSDANDPNGGDTSADTQNPVQENPGVFVLVVIGAIILIIVVIVIIWRSYYSYREPEPEAAESLVVTTSSAPGAVALATPRIPPSLPPSGSEVAVAVPPGSAPDLPLTGGTTAGRPGPTTDVIRTNVIPQTGAQAAALRPGVVNAPALRPVRRLRPVSTTPYRPRPRVG